MIKVLLVTHYFASHRGGVEIAAFNIAKILAKTNSFDIKWLAADCDKQTVDIVNLSSIPLKSFNFIEKFLPFPYPIISLSGICKLYKEARSCDVIHIHDYLYHSNITAFLFAKLFTKKIIITQHIGFIPYKNLFLRFLLDFTNKILGRFILNSCDEVVFISDNVRKYFREYCNLKRNLNFQPNPVDSNIFHHFENYYLPEQLTNFEKNKIKKIFLFAGRFTEKKGLQFLKVIISKFPDSLWIFAGWGQIDPNSWGYDNVKTYNYCDQSELNKLYNFADYLIIPSYGEGFPLVIQEAFASGLPVITTEVNAQAFPQAVDYLITINTDDLDSCIDKLYNIENNIYKYEITKEELIRFSERYWSEKACCLFYSDIIKGRKIENQFMLGQTK
jgi:glycosyltransferase involved in cell wall biosynthesis